MSPRLRIVDRYGAQWGGYFQGTLAVAAAIESLREFTKKYPRNAPFSLAPLRSF